MRRRRTAYNRGRDRGGHSIRLDTPPFEGIRWEANPRRVTELPQSLARRDLRPECFPADAARAAASRGATLMGKNEMARPAGLEPAASRLEGRGHGADAAFLSVVCGVAHASCPRDCAAHGLAVGKPYLGFVGATLMGSARTRIRDGSNGMLPLLSASTSGGRFDRIARANASGLRLPCPRN